MEDALEEMVMGLLLADMDDAGMFQFLGQHLHHPLMGSLLDRIEGVVDQKPIRLLKTDAGKGQRMLLVVGELLVPALVHVELAQQAVETDPAKRTQIYQDLNRRFAEQAWNSWSWYTVWGLAAKPDVKGILGPPLPDGQGKPFPLYGGTVQVLGESRSD